MVVTDNGSNFVGKEFEAFLKQNGIRHIKTAAYHPSSNGLAERAVQTFKEGMKKLKKKKEEEAVETCNQSIAFLKPIPNHSSDINRSLDR